MSSKKSTKRVSQSVGGECKAKVARKPSNLITLTEDEAAQQTAPTLSSCVHEEVKLMFAPHRYVVYSRFRDMDLVHIREYEVKTVSSSMGECEYPTRKGVCFTPARLWMLRTKIDEIDEQLKLQSAPHPQPSPAYKVHLGAGVYVSTGNGFNCVDIRRHWIPEGQSTITPTKCGIALSPRQWTSLKEKLTELLTLHPELAAAEPCFHQNQEGMIDCRECTPFGWLM